MPDGVESGERRGVGGDERRRRRERGWRGVAIEV